MKALLLTGQAYAWTEPLGDYAWPLVPAGNRPLIETWLEACVAWGITDVRILLGKHAYAIEEFCGDGSNWGLNIRYSFLRPDKGIHDFLKRDPEQWKDGVLCLTAPVHLGVATDSSVPAEDGIHAADDLVILKGSSAVRSYIKQERFKTNPISGIFTRPVRSLNDLFELNRHALNGNLHSQVAGGYGERETTPEGSTVGYHVVLPPSCELEGPLSIGNHCRVGSFSKVGPETLLEDHVVVGHGANIKRSLILNHTYIGDGVNIEDKIVAGNRLIDPTDANWISLDDLLIASLSDRSSWKIQLATLFGKLVALLLLPCMMLIDFIQLLSKGKAEAKTQQLIDKQGLAYSVPNPQRWSWSKRMIQVIQGRLCLTGHTPYQLDEMELYQQTKSNCPGAFQLHQAIDPVEKQFNVRYANSERGLKFALRTLRTTLAGWAKRQGKET